MQPTWDMEKGSELFALYFFISSLSACPLPLPQQPCTCLQQPRLGVPLLFPHTSLPCPPLFGDPLHTEKSSGE